MANRENVLEGRLPLILIKRKGPIVQLTHRTNVCGMARRVAAKQVNPFHRYKNLQKPNERGHFRSRYGKC